jgi:hypothetical protein
MKTLIWNIRWFRVEGRRRQLKEYLCQENVDIVGLQETIKQNFLLADL